MTGEKEIKKNRNKNRVINGKRYDRKKMINNAFIL